MLRFYDGSLTKDSFKVEKPNETNVICFEHELAICQAESLKALTESMDDEGSHREKVV